MLPLGYVLRDVGTGKEYVGITSRYPHRIYEHRQKGVMSGRDFTVEIVAFFSDMEAARLWEIAEIERRGVSNLLNTSTGGFGGRGRAWTPEMKKAASERAKARQADPEYRARMSTRCREVWADPEKREQQRVLSVASINKEARSRAQKKAWSDETTRERRIAGITRYANTEEGRASRRAAQLRRWGKA